MSKESPPAFAHGSPEHGGHPGMSRRDYFAAAALRGMMANPFFIREFAKIAEVSGTPTEELIATAAGRQADAMEAEAENG